MSTPTRRGRGGRRLPPEPVAELLSIDRDRALGRHVTEVVEKTRMHVGVRPDGSR